VSTQPPVVAAEARAAITPVGVEDLANASAAVTTATTGRATVSGVAPAPGGIAAFWAHPTPRATRPPSSSAAPATSIGRRRPARTSAAVTNTVRPSQGNGLGASSSR
jgi:hypothetical protein